MVLPYLWKPVGWNRFFEKIANTIQSAGAERIDID